MRLSILDVLAVACGIVAIAVGCHGAPDAVHAGAAKNCVGPEDPDGYEDHDDCADPDNDGDRILDTADACPNDPGIRREGQDNGCPNKASVAGGGQDVGKLDNGDPVATVKALEAAVDAGPPEATAKRLAAALADHRMLIQFEQQLIDSRNPVVRREFRNRRLVKISVFVEKREVPFTVTDVGTRAGLLLGSLGPVALPEIRAAIAGEEGVRKNRALVALYNLRDPDSEAMKLQSMLWQKASFTYIHPPDLYGTEPHDPWSASSLVGYLGPYGVRVVQGGCQCEHEPCPSDRMLRMAAERLVERASPSDVELHLAVGEARRECGSGGPFGKTDAILAAFTLEQLIPWVTRTNTAARLVAEKGNSAVPKLIEIENESRDASLVSVVADILGRIGDQRAIGPVISAFRRNAAGELNGEPAGANNFRFSYALSRITGQNFKSAAEWQAWWLTQPESKKPGAR